MTMCLYASVYNFIRGKKCGRLTATATSVFKIIYAVYKILYARPQIVSKNIFYTLTDKFAHSYLHTLSHGLPPKIFNMFIRVYKKNFFPISLS